MSVRRTAVPKKYSRELIIRKKRQQTGVVLSRAGRRSFGSFSLCLVGAPLTAFVSTYEISSEQEI